MEGGQDALGMGMRVGVGAQTRRLGWLQYVFANFVKNSKVWAYCHNLFGLRDDGQVGLS